MVLPSINTEAILWISYRSHHLMIGGKKSVNMRKTAHGEPGDPYPKRCLTMCLPVRSAWSLPWTAMISPATVRSQKANISLISHTPLTSAISSLMKRTEGSAWAKNSSLMGYPIYRHRAISRSIWSATMKAFTKSMVLRSLTEKWPLEVRSKRSICVRYSAFYHTFYPSIMLPCSSSSS